MASQFKSFSIFFLVAAIAVTLPGCCWKKRGCKSSEQSLKSGKKEYSKGIPLAGLDKDGQIFFDEDIDGLSLFDDEGSSLKSKKNNVLKTAYMQDSFKPVYFDFDKHNIREDQKAILNHDIDAAKKITNDGVSLTVEGHADKHYVSEVYNLAVSQRRAHTVAHKLAESGVKSSSLKPVGFGAEYPAVDVSGKEQKNRRVELHVTNV